MIKEKMVFMKGIKVLSLLTAAIMGAACFNMNAAAETSFAAGDVDMDGIVTGHDTAMVSRYLVTDGYTLTDEQLALADVDGDGEVTQADADKLYNEMQVYPIGLVLYSEKDYISIDDGDVILKYIANTGAGIDYPMTQIQMNLADIDADGNVTLDDATLDLTIYAMRHAGMHKELDARTVYYYTFEENDPGFLNNIN